MVTVLLLAVFLGTGAAVVLIIYLIDRVNRLEKMASISSSSEKDKRPSNADNTFLGLSGKGLWDAMCGKPPEGFNSNDLVALKPRYEHVLKKHVVEVFNQGRNHSQSGDISKKPSPTFEVKTLRGSIESWMPPQHVSTIYNVGYESVNANEEDLMRLATSLDESTGLIYSRADITMAQPFSSLLLAASAQEEILDDLESDPEIDQSEDEDIFN